DIGPRRQVQHLAGMNEVIGTDAVPARHLAVVEPITPGDRIQRVAALHFISAACRQLRLLPAIRARATALQRETAAEQDQNVSYSFHMSNRMPHSTITIQPIMSMYSPSWRSMRSPPKRISPATR